MKFMNNRGWGVNTFIIFLFFMFFSMIVIVIGVHNLSNNNIVGFARESAARLR